MTFTDEQRRKLAAPLDPKLVKVKPVPGSPKYIPGYVAMEAANAIFGAENWGYTIDQVTSAELPGGTLYTAHVSVTVTGCHPKQDVGCEIASNTKEGKPASVQAHETALKGAVTDGIKRALRSYGDPWGLQLYDKDANLAGDYAAWQREQAGDGEEGDAQSEPEMPRTGQKRGLAVVPQPSGMDALRAEVEALLQRDSEAGSKLPKSITEMNAEELQKTVNWLKRRARALSS